MSTSPTSALASLPTPDERVPPLIDHQPLPYLHSHDATTVSDNALGLAGAAGEHHVPTVLTTVVEEHKGALLQPLPDAVVHQRPIQRHPISPWDDRRVVDAVAATGRTKPVVAGLHTEAAVTMSALRASAGGLDVIVSRPVRATGWGAAGTSTAGWDDEAALTAFAWAQRLLAAPAART
ncbi:isochorismatase family protein [Streptomyces sp. NPDC096132]|uniref:isochorismatase family protein n=1 Tax=Streptomyces sp. NPDC096132 TaxID=3366075 RepID=UPI0037F8EC5A